MCPFVLGYANVWSFVLGHANVLDICAESC